MRPAMFISHRGTYKDIMANVVEWFRSTVVQILKGAALLAANKKRHIRPAIFISYRRTHKNVVTAVAEWLRSAGARV